MRYIDRSKLRKPTGWNQRAQTATQAVLCGANPNDHSAVWRELKDELASLSHDKCWYCESPVERSDNAVDHFRPKNSVSDAARPHSGYRWLAFDETNFRYACTYCNSRRRGADGATTGGKGDLFPLVDEASRVYLPGPITDEHPVLLDPCEMADCRLIGCQQENGKSCSNTLDPIGRTRAETSIKIYHLNHEPTCKRRHGIAIQLLSDVEDAKRLFERATLDSTREMEFKKVANKIRRAIDSESPYSGEMLFLLKCQRTNDHPWIQDVIEA